MAKFVLLDCRAFTAGADLSGWTNKAEVQAERESKDVTNYRSAGWTECIAGLGNATISIEGQWEAGDTSYVDDASWAQLGGAGPWTLTPTDALVDTVAYFTNAIHLTDSDFSGGVGEVADFKVGASSTWPLVRGRVANPPGTARTATGTGTALSTLTAVTASQQVYAALHVLSATGTTPSATFRVESAPTVGFAAPTTRITFNAATARGGQIARAAGPITDAFWRAAWTISGTSPSFLACLVIGIA